MRLHSLGAHLRGGQPDREGARVVFDEDAKETLKAAKDGTVDHDGPLLGILLINVGHVKPAGPAISGNMNASARASTVPLP